MNIFNTDSTCKPSSGSLQVRAYIVHRTYKLLRGIWCCYLNDETVSAGQIIFNDPSSRQLTTETTTRSLSKLTLPKPKSSYSDTPRKLILFTPPEYRNNHTITQQTYTPKTKSSYSNTQKINSLHSSRAHELSCKNWRYRYLWMRISL